MAFRPLMSKDEVVAFKLSTVNGLPDNNIRRIQQDSTDYLYFYTIYTVYRYDGYSFTELTDDEVAKMDSVLTRHHKSVAVGGNMDNRGNRYKVNDDGTLIYEDSSSGESIRLKVFDSKLLAQTNNLKLRVLTDCRGLIWVSVNGNGIFLYNRGTRQLRHLTHETAPQLIDSDYVVYMMEDSMGRIWVSQEHYGAVCLNVVKQNSSVIDFNGEADNRDNIRMVRRISGGEILIADNYGTLYRADGTLSNIRKMFTDGNNYISALKDCKGRLWLGSRFNGVTVDGRRYGKGRVDCIVEDRKGRIWLCGINGDVIQAVLDDEGNYAERHFFSDIDLLAPRVMVPGNDGNIWLGTKKGLFCFDSDNPHHYRLTTDEPVRSLLLDKRGKLWVGTEGGGLVCQTDNSRFTTSEGLPNGVVQFMVEDAHGYLCIGTEDGCVYYDPVKKTIRQSLYFNDCLVRNFYNENSGVLLDDGRVAMGTLGGIVVADKELDTIESNAMPVVLTGWTVNGIPSLDRPDGAGIDLPYDRNTLMLSFSNFAYGQTRQTVYSFRLDGYDSDWGPVSSSNNVTYRNLPPGRYVLHVRSRVANGPWSYTSLPVRISPPWWQSWWAYVLYLIIAIVAAYIIYRQVRHVARLRQRIAVEKQLTEYKLKFFTNISHEFRTPLTLIQGTMDRLRQLPETPAAARAPLNNMQRNVDRMLRLINQLLEFRRMQNNKLSLSLEETDVVAFVSNLCQVFTDAAEQKNISLSFIPSMKTYSMYIDRGFIDKAVYNLLSNSFKYTPEGGCIVVRVKEGEERMLKIICEDTGCGVPEEWREKIFDRFARGQLNRDSLGIGLDLTAELIRTHHGSIRCDANPGGGSVFTITLPTDRSVYDERDFLCEAPVGSEKRPLERQGFTETVREIMPEPMNNHRVLVVEDDVDIAEYLKRELGLYFVVDLAENGEEALRHINDCGDNVYSLIITDAMMPRMDGFQVLRRLRSDVATRHLPVIMLTALDDSEHQLKGMELGADAYLTKPFSLQLLLLQCRNLLQRNDFMKDVLAGDKKPVAHAAKEIVMDKRDQRLLAQFSIYVDSHLSTPDLSVDRFAEDMGYGRTNFYKKLKALTGQTPNEYIREHRLQKAYELLSSTNNITVAEVAYQVGMATSQYLSTVFKKRFGISPKQIRTGENVDEKPLEES